MGTNNDTRLPKLVKTGFIPIKNKNIKFPHIIAVILQDDWNRFGCTIGGSVSDTQIGKIIAHSIEIGSIAWFVEFAEVPPLVTMYLWDRQVLLDI